MQPFLNIDADTYGQLKKFIGSFWNTRFGEKTKVSMLTSMAVKNRLLGTFRTNAYNVMGEHDLAKLEKYAVMQFDPAGVVVTNQLVYDDPARFLLYQDAVQVRDAYDAGGVTYYVIPRTTHIPRTCQAGQILLLLGIDFFCLGCWIFFRQDPRLLFPTGRISMPVAERVAYKPLLTYLLRAEVPDNSQYVVQYYRGKQTPQAFLLALAAVGGLAITHYDQKLIHALPRNGGMVYVFEQETLRVDYPHTALVEGTVYSADTIIGDGIKIYHNQGKGNDWWRQADWGPGILLDPVLPQFPGIVLLDRSSVAYGAGNDAGSVAGSKQHTRIKLSDDFDREVLYWDWVAERETVSGKYLNSVIGLPDNGDAFATMRANYADAKAFNERMGLPPEQPDLEALPGVKLVNALDVFFANVLNAQGMVIEVQREQIKNLSFFYRFLQREMLVGTVPIVLSSGPSLGVESVEVGVNINIGTESPVFSSVHLPDLTETVELSRLVTDVPDLSYEAPIEI